MTGELKIAGEWGRRGQQRRIEQRLWGGHALIVRERETIDLTAKRAEEGIGALLGGVEMDKGPKHVFGLVGQIPVLMGFRLDALAWSYQS